MTKYLLVSFKTCPWVQRAAIILREKQVDFEFRHIDPDNRPEWFLAISPHRKVPVLRIDDRCRCSNRMPSPSIWTRRSRRGFIPKIRSSARLNRAWTDYVPTFARLVTATAYADTEADYSAATGNISLPFDRLEKALEKQGKGPYFNGAEYSLVDAAYAPVPAALPLLDRIRSSAISRHFLGCRHGARR